LQPSQSFKARGIGLYCKTALQKTPNAHLVVASSGNAALACSYAASVLGAPCTVFLPENTPQNVKSSLEADGSKVSVVGHNYHQALVAAQEFVQRTNDA